MPIMEMGFTYFGPNAPSGGSEGALGRECWYEWDGEIPYRLRLVRNDWSSNIGPSQKVKWTDDTGVAVVPSEDGPYVADPKLPKEGVQPRDYFYIVIEPH